MKTGDFDYSLPQELIAQTPIEPRDHSRLMILDRASGTITHRRFFDIAEYLRSGDVLVFNDSRVIPARLHGKKADTGGKVELLLLRRMSAGVWEALARPGGRLRPGSRIELQGRSGATLTAEILENRDGGIKLVSLPGDNLPDGLGEIALPPYVHHLLQDPERYQTVYSRVSGSVAAPTAGLHFTASLLDKLQKMGVQCRFVTLHIGLDTFRPVTEENPLEHTIHREYAELTPETAAALSSAKLDGRRIISVGTTTARILEHAATLSAPDGIKPFAGWVDLFILPGYKFRITDAMVTNFHLPRSTLLMLVSAFAGKELIDKAYGEAIKQEYRFYSFGDAMMII